MPDHTHVANRRFVLKSRPTRIPEPEHFAEETVTIRPPDRGEVLLETLLLSIDPSMRGAIGATPPMGACIEIGDVMRGSGIARVLESRAEGFLPGEIVQGTIGWESHPTLRAEQLEKVDLALGGPLDWMGCSA